MEVQYGTMRADVQFDLKALMARHKVTIRELSARTGVPMKRIREIRAMGRVSYCHYCDYTQAVTGENVFSRATYNAFYDPNARRR
jgi:hypothetical protein